MKFTMKWLFSSNSFVKFDGKQIKESQHNCVIFKSVL